MSEASTKPNFDAGSFRDRAARVFYADGSVYRALSEQGLRDWNRFASTKLFGQLMAEQKIVGTEQIPTPAEFSKDWAGVLRHETIPFLSYPYEWSFGMLRDAALLHLELVKNALREDMILKDSSSFNIQWHGTRPVLMDVLSFEKLSPGEPWVGYRQFCEMFLYPLFLQSYKGIRFQPWLRGSIDGILAEDCDRLMSKRDLFRKGVLTHVYLQSKLQSQYGAARSNVKGQIKQAGFHKGLIEANVKGLMQTVGRLKLFDQKTEWSGYATDHSYSPEEMEVKKSFVREAVATSDWNLVWDIGANRGIFSRIAAEKSRYTIAMDYDHLAVELMYQELKKEQNTHILPLVVNLADPPPAQGWRGKERKSLPERGKPDLILCLALIHHMVITANVPMQEFLDWLAENCKHLVIEFPTKDDAMVQVLLQNKEDWYSDYDLKNFERLLYERFQPGKRLELMDGKRILYLVERKS